MKSYSELKDLSFDRTWRLENRSQPIEKWKIRIRINMLYKFTLQFFSENILILNPTEK